MFDGSMSMSLHTLNYSAKLLGKKYKNGTNHYARVIPTLATSPSSIPVQIGENDNYPNCGKLSVPSMSLPKRECSSAFMVNQYNAIGIIGGASVDCSLNFLHKLVQWGSKEGNETPSFLLCSDPQLREELLLYERSSFPSLLNRSQRSHFDHTQIVANVRRKREFLEQGGARCVVMPCHLLHSWYDDISDGCNVPILHMGECVAKELREADLKPLEAGSPLRIGLVGTDAILSAGFYQEKLQNEGFEVVLPDKATMEHTVLPAIEALSRKDIEGARNLLRIALQVLLVRAVNMIIVASHDMHELLPHDDPLLKKCVDPIDSLMRSTIKWSQNVKGDP